MLKKGFVLNNIVILLMHFMMFTLWMAWSGFIKETYWDLKMEHYLLWKEYKDINDIYISVK